MDDMGYGDVGTFGGDPALTPNLDRLAQQGMAARDFYVPQPVCSPSRAGLLTGVHPARQSVYRAFFPNSKAGLNPNETTIAEYLGRDGYATAMFGKWHLGDAPEFNPTEFGFQEFYGIPYSNDMWPHGDAPKGLFPPLPMFEGKEVVDPDITPDEQKVLTKTLTERAVAFIERNRDHPFFLYLAHPMPHRPLFVSDAFEGKSGKGLYADVLMEIDWSVGQIIEALRETGELDNTFLVFTSDNGPWLRCGNHAGSPGILSKGKLTVFEGGVRVPTILHFPGRIPAGSETREPLMTTDLLPTFLHYAGVTDLDRPVDGKNIADVIEGRPGAKSPHEILPFYFQENELQAVRAGKWKLIYRHHLLEPVPGQEGQDGRMGPDHIVVQPLALYDMENDPGEQNDLSRQHPEIVEEIDAKVQAWREDIGDTIEGYPGKNRRPVGIVP